MFEKRLKELSKEIGEEKINTFHILTHEKHRREIYFQNNNNTLKFIGAKLIKGKQAYKKIPIYLLLKLNLIQPFLKKIKLSKKFGQAIFVAEKINCFDLKKREVLSFQKDIKSNNEFILSKKFQQKVAKREFAPKIYELNKKIPYSKEKLLSPFLEKNGYKLFVKLMKFYQKQGIKKIPIKKYILNLEKELKKKDIKDKFIYETLNFLKKKNIYLMVSLLHGDFAKENTLIDKNGKIAFIDWHPYKGLITNSIINYFRNTKKIKSNKYFKKIIKAFPKEVQKNINPYLILSEIELVLKKGKPTQEAIKKIKTYF